MKFIIESTSTRDVSDLLEADAQAASALVAQGVFVNVWPKADFSGAVVLAEADNEESLRNSVSTMPTVQAGVTQLTVIALAETPS